MTEEWKKSKIIESGNFPKHNFKGVLKAVYPAVNENLNTQELRLDFEDGKTLSILMFNKDGTKGVFLEDDNTVRVDGFKISQFCASIERLDVKTGEPNNNNNDPSIKRFETEWAFIDEIPAGFRTVPNSIGCTLSMIATPGQVGDTAQSEKGAKFPDWTIGKIEGLQSKPTSKPAAKAPAKGKAAAPAPLIDGDLIIKIEDMLLENDKLSVGDIYQAFGGTGKSPYKPDQIRAAIAVINAKGGN